MTILNEERKRVKLISGREIKLLSGLKLFFHPPVGFMFKQKKKSGGVWTVSSFKTKLFREHTIINNFSNVQHQQEKPKASFCKGPPLIFPCLKKMCVYHAGEWLSKKIARSSARVIPQHLLQFYFAIISSDLLIYTILKSYPDFKEQKRYT